MLSERLSARSSADSAPVSDGSALSDLAGLGEAFWNSAIQNPINGLTQLANVATEPLGAKIPELHLFDPATPTSETGKLCQQVGAVAGMIVPFMLARGAVGFTGEKLGIQVGSSVAAQAAEQGATGAVMGFALTPSQPGENLWLGRVKNGAIDAGTFAAMGAAGAKLSSSLGANADLSLASRIARGSLIGMGSAIPGGAVNAELSSLLSGRGLAGKAELENDVAGFAVFGGLLGAVGRGYPDAISDEKAQAVPERPETPLEPQSILEQRFPTYSQDQLQAGRAAVMSELAQVKASSTDGTPTSVLDKLNQSNLADSQKERVLNGLAAVRENYTSFRSDGKLDPDQEKNWIHTQGEFGRVIDSARAMKMTPDQTEDALLASMFSDSVKTKFNFTVHHIAGAQAAETFLRDSGLGDDRIHGITQAAKEHQIGPPGFMAMIYTGKIKSSLTADQRADPAIPIAITGIGDKISNPLGVTLTDTGEGGKGVAFTPLEQQLLKYTGNDQWYVPDAGTPWYQASRAVINGDSIDNYATPGGFSKLVGLNGPETDRYFQDATIDDSLASPRRSFTTAYTIMTPEGKALADAELSNTDAAIDRAKGRTEQWLRQTKGLQPDQPLPEIPFWNSDLAYPTRSAQIDNEFWNVLKIAPENRTAEEQQFFQEHRYDGLDQQQIGDFEFAKQIRDKMVDELRKEQRLDGQLPPDYTPVMKS